MPQCKIRHVSTRIDDLVILTGHDSVPQALAHSLAEAATLRAELAAAETERNALRAALAECAANLAEVGAEVESPGMSRRDLTDLIGAMADRSRRALDGAR